ncbi:MAG: eukaryotic-like serine/threonine-protein kinase [Blastocatellia bacterium]
MKPKNWQRTEVLFHEAMGLSAEERAVYLAKVCVDDASLRREVESLIAAFENKREFMERPAFSLGMKVLAEEPEKESLVGKQIGSYQIQVLLGRGGMGEVYLAQDDRLDRKVALKFLSHPFTDDAWAKRQLKKEAQAIGRLDHPNICVVHDFEEHDGYNFIVMQYIEGETLASLIRNGTFPSEKISHLAIQIVSALIEAHSHGIIHRDIKPQNIMVTATGQVKVLDFGLAKHVQQKPDALNMAESESAKLGLVVGTIAYMSPEQLRSERLDYRSDIFSFGIVLYEMISCSTHIQPGLTSIVQKCLQRDRELRYQSASELLLDLDNPPEVARLSPRRPARYQIRNYVAAVLLLLLVLAILMVYLKPSRIQTLAVLPIVNKSKDANAEILSKGLTEGITNRLSSLSKLKVKAPTVIPAYEDDQEAQRRILSDFNVQAVLFGTLTTENEALALEVKLVDSADGLPIWEDKYIIAPGELLSLQSDLAYKLASKLHLSLSEDEKRLLFARPTENEEACRMYFYGRYYWNDRNKENIKKAINFFDRAVKLDPYYAKAYAGLADSYVLLSAVTFGRPISTREAMNNAKWAANKAIEIDDTLAEAHTSKAVYLLKYEWDWQAAEKEFKRAIELNPEYSPAHFWYSRLLGLKGREDEAIRESEIAWDLEPFAPPSIMNVGLAYYYSRHYDKAIEYCRMNLERNPDHLATLNVLGLAYLQKGMLQDSIKVFQKLYAADNFYGAAPLGFAYGRAGRKSEALEILDKLSKEPDIPPQEKALIYIGLGEKERAYALLQQACSDKFATFPFLMMEPFLDSIRTDPGIIELVKCAKLSS